jgi:hypothetical protein
VFHVYAIILYPLLPYMECESVYNFSSSQYYLPSKDEPHRVRSISIGLMHLRLKRLKTNIITSPEFLFH